MDKALFFILVLLLALFPNIRAQDNDQGAFVTPPPTGAIHDYTENPLYQIGQPLTIEWTTSWQTVNLRLWQNDNPSPEQLLQNQPNTGKLQWHVQTSKNYTAQSGSRGEVFFLQVVQADVTQPKGFGSHYFNITGPASTSSSSSSSSSLISSPTTFSTTATAILSPPAPSSPGLHTQAPAGTAVSASPSSIGSAHSNADSDDGSGRSSSSSSSSSSSDSSKTSALAVGLGVSLGLAVLGLIGATAFICFRRHDRQRQKKQGQNIEASPPQDPASTDDVPAYQPKPSAAIGCYYYQNSKQLNVEPVEAMEKQRTSIELPAGDVESSWESLGKPVRSSKAYARHVPGVHEMPVATKDDLVIRWH